MFVDATAPIEGQQAGESVFISLPNRIQGFLGIFQQRLHVFVLGIGVGLGHEVIDLGQIVARVQPVVLRVEQGLLLASLGCLDLGGAGFAFTPFRRRFEGFVMGLEELGRLGKAGSGFFIRGLRLGHEILLGFGVFLSMRLLQERVPDRQREDTVSIERRPGLGVRGVLLQELVELGAGLVSQLFGFADVLGEQGGHLHAAGQLQIERLGHAGGNLLVRLQLLEVIRPQVAQALLPQAIDELLLQLHSRQREGGDQQQGCTHKRPETTTHRQILCAATSLRRGWLHCCRLIPKNVARRSAL